jgi:hypothetical protein
MRRLLILLPVVAIAAASAAALVVSAGPSGAGAGTTGYTVYFPPTINSTDDVALELPPPGDVGPAQDPGCDAQLATVDLASGVVTPLPASPSETACAGDLAFAPDGTLYGLVQGDGDAGPVAELVTFDLSTGNATLVGAFGPFQYSTGGANELPQGGITFDATGTLYALLGHSNSPGFDLDCAPESTEFLNFCLYRVDDPSNPAASTLVGLTTTDGVLPSMLAATCETVYAGTFSQDDDFSSVSTVNTETGARDQIGSLGDERFLEGADFDFAGTFWGLIINNSDFAFDLSTLDPAGGTPIDTPGPTMTVEGDDTPFFNALAVQPLDCAEPEPAPIVLEPTFTG